MTDPTPDPVPVPVPAPQPKKAVIYAGLAFLIAALTQLSQVMVAAAANQASVLDSPTRWALSAVTGIVAAGAVAAVPYLAAVLPPPK